MGKFNVFSCDFNNTIGAFLRLLLRPPINCFLLSGILTRITHMPNKIIINGIKLMFFSAYLVFAMPNAV